VLVGRFEWTPTDLDPAEVSAVRWESMTALIDELNANSAHAYTPWLGRVCQMATAGRQEVLTACPRGESTGFRTDGADQRIVSGIRRERRTFCQQSAT